MSEPQEIRICLAETLVLPITTIEAAAKVGLDMRDAAKPIVVDAAKALGKPMPVPHWPDI